jgi:hypothetical protein
LAGFLLTKIAGKPLEAGSLLPQRNLRRALEVGDRRRFRPLRKPFLSTLLKNSRFVSGYAFGHTVGENGSGSSRCEPMFPHQGAFFSSLLDRSFLLDDHSQVRSHILVQLDGDHEFTQRPERLMELNFATIHIEALLLQRVPDIAGRN